MFFTGIHSNPGLGLLVFVGIESRVLVVVQRPRDLRADDFLLFLERQLILFELAVEAQLKVVHAKPLPGNFRVGDFCARQLNLLGAFIAEKLRATIYFQFYKHSHSQRVVANHFKLRGIIADERERSFIFVCERVDYFIYAFNARAAHVSDRGKSLLLTPFK